jgi:ankyrin repeat protein
VQFVNNDKNFLFEVDYFHQTPLHWAAKRGYNDLLSFLIQKEPSLINTYDHNKRTPLFLAAKNNQLSMCQLLLNKQANPLLEDSENAKPVDVTTDPVVKKLINDFMEVKIKKYNI